MQGDDLDSGDTISLKVRLPIVGWSSNMLISESFSSTVIAVEGRGNAGEVLAASTDAVPFLETEDTSASWDGTAFTAPVTGYYNFNGNMKWTTSTDRQPFIRVNGGTITKAAGPINVGTQDTHFNITQKLNKGDFASLTSSNTAGTLDNNANRHVLSITKIQTPQSLVGGLKSQTPIITRFLTPGATTYNTPIGATRLEVRVMGAGGGGHGSDTTTYPSAASGVTSGTASNFGGTIAVGNGGALGGWTGQSNGGTASGSVAANNILIVQGGDGSAGNRHSGVGFTLNNGGSSGGVSHYGGAGGGTEGNGQAAATNSGSGGAAAGIANRPGTSNNLGGGGAAGGFAHVFVHNPGASYSVLVGTGGTGGAAGSTGLGGFAGGKKQKWISRSSVLQVY